MINPLATVLGGSAGEFLGYTWMALPFTDPTSDDPPTGDQSWTCFLSAANFEGPIAYYIPETWSKIGKLFHYPFLYGRGLDARPGVMGGGAMEINTVPRFDAKDAHGTTYSKLPKLQWPVDAKGRAFLVQDVTYYSKVALFDAFKAWRDDGPACSGRFEGQGAFQPKLSTRTTRYDQGGKKIVAEERVAMPAADVPAETRLLAQEFKLAKPGVPYTSPTVGAWRLATCLSSRAKLHQPSQPVRMSNSLAKSETRRHGTSKPSRKPKTGSCPQH